MSYKITDEEYFIKLEEEESLFKGYETEDVSKLKLTTIRAT